MGKDSINYKLFQILITFTVALVFLAERLKPYILQGVYKFLKDNRDIFIGIYYLYLTYELYQHLFIEKDN
jgi:hypothetical protein